MTPGQTFNPEVTVQTIGFSLDCSRSFLENMDGNKYGTHPIHGCVALGNNQYRFSFATPMKTPDSAGEYHSKWKVWNGLAHIGPEIDLWFRSAQPTPNNRPHPPTLKSPSDWSEVRSETAPALCWNDHGDPDGDSVAFWAEVYESAVIMNSGWIRSTCWRPSNLDRNYFGYQWRVRAQDSKGAISEWSPTWHFTLSPPPNDPPQPTTAPPSMTPVPPKAGLWWDATWGYRAALNTPANVGLSAGTIIKVDGTDLDVLVGQGKSRADHNDVRVVRRISETSWQEVARVYYTGWDLEFILPADLPAGTSNAYYLYYGNPNAGAPPTFSLPQGWWVDMYIDKWWESYVGTWEFNQAMDFGGSEQICYEPINHRSRTGSSFDDSDKFRGRLFIPTTGTWTFRVYTNDGYRLSLDDVEVGRFDGYDTNRWATIGSLWLKAGWYSMDLRDMWVNCGAWRFAMEGPGFANQIVPANYFQKVWGNVHRGVSAGTEEPYTVVYPPTATPAPTNTPMPTATATPTSTPIPVPQDTIPPLISHQPITATLPNLPLTLVADITDNVGVWGATLFYRPMGATEYLRQSMAHLEGDRYAATLAASTLIAPGVVYYIEASDGVNITRSAQPTAPHRIAITDSSQLMVISPNAGPATGGITVTLTGNNFAPGAIVTFAGTPCQEVTVVSDREITCITPPHLPDVVDVTITHPDGQRSTLLRGYTYTSDMAMISLPHTGGEPRTTVQVPLLIEQVSDLVAFEGKVTFDPTVVSVRRILPGTLTRAWSTATNTNTPGQIRLAMASVDTSVRGIGSLAVIEFDVVGAQPMTSTLRLSDVRLNDGAIDAKTIDGSFTIGWMYSVTGNVAFWKNSTPVPNVQLTMSRSERSTTFSNAGGVYTITNIPAGTYTLTPEKRNDVNGIDAYDASLVLRHAAGLITLVGGGAQAADVNRSGSISAMDAYYILQYVVGRISVPFPGAGAVWIFDPAMRTYELTTNQSGQNFRAILIGDVSGNWSMSGQRNGAHIAPLRTTPDQRSANRNRTTQGGPAPSIQIIYSRPDNDGGVTATLVLDPRGVDVYSVDLLIRYNPAQVSDVTASHGSLSHGWMLGTNSKEPGRVRLALAGALPITTSGEIIELQYRLHAALAAEALRVEWSQVNEEIPVTPIPTTKIYLPLLRR